MNVFRVRYTSLRPVWIDITIAFGLALNLCAPMEIRKYGFGFNIAMESLNMGNQIFG